MPFHAYKTLNVTDSDNNISENKDQKSDVQTQAPERSKRSDIDDEKNPEEEQVPISFSDHEAVTSTMHLWASKSV